MTTTQELSPLTTVTAIYEAFGRGDIPAILDLLAEDVVFDDDSIQSAAQEAGHPLLSAHHGKQGAAALFAELGNYTFHHFEVTDLLAGDGVVAARVVIDLSYPSGVRLHDEEMHLWRFDADGLVIGMRHYSDTAKHLAAWPGDRRGGSALGFAAGSSARWNLSGPTAQPASPVDLAPCARGPFPAEDRRKVTRWR